jgi:hypothetical protein
MKIKTRLKKLFQNAASITVLVVNKTFLSDSLGDFSALFRKNYKFFNLIGVDLDTPGAIEVTFIRNDLISYYNSPIALLYLLDQSSIHNISKNIITEIWWKK